MTDAVEKAGEAAVAVAVAEAATAEKIAAVESNAADLVEIAADRVENAEAVAQAITDAAVMTELGRRIDGLATELSECRNANQTVVMELAGLKSTLADLSAKLPPSLIMPPMDQPPARGSPIPQASGKTELVLAENPSDADEGGLRDQEPSKKRKRFAL
jgi:hypothetical protein